MNENKKMDIPTTEQLKKELDRLKYKRRYIRTLTGTFGVFIAAAAAVVLLSVLIFPVMRITGTSMEPTFKEDQIILCNRASHIKRGDIIAFYHNKKILVKRVIGLPGDEVSIDETGKVTVNGSVIDEPYAVLSGKGECDISYPYTVPLGRYFVLGDAREISVDSRSTAVGCVAEENIIGRTTMVLLPFRDFGRIG